MLVCVMFVINKLLSSRIWNISNGVNFILELFSSFHPETVTMKFFSLQACTGSDAYKNKNKIDGLSFSWDLPGTGKLTLWKTCDADYEC